MRILSFEIKIIFEVKTFDILRKKTDIVIESSFPSLGLSRAIMAIPASLFSHMNQLVSIFSHKYCEFEQSNIACVLVLWDQQYLLWENSSVS
jgi:hypothetical protein